MFKSLLSYSFAIWVSFLISLISVPIITRIMPPEDYGVLTLVISVSFIIMNIFLLGTDQSLMKYYNISKVSNLKALYFKYFNLILIVVALIMAILIKFAIEGDYLFVAFATLFIAIGLSILRISEQINRLTEKKMKFFIQTVAYAFISKLLILIIYILFKDLNYLLIGLAISTCVFGMIIFKFTEFENSEVLSKSESYINLSDLIKFGLPLMFSSLIYLLKDFIPRIYLFQLNDTVGLGEFSAALSLTSLINIFQAGFIAFYAPFFYKNYISLRQEVNIIYKLFTYMMINLSFVAIHFSDLIINFLGDDYSGAEGFFVILIISPICIAISETFVLIINIKNKPLMHLYISGATVVITTFLTWFFYAFFGAIGSALAAAISSIVFLFLRLYFSNKYMDYFYGKYKIVVSVFVLLTFSIISLMNILTILSVNKLFLVLIFLIINTSLFMSELISVYKKRRI